MRKNQSSLTAAGITIARGVESQKAPEERICYDPYARQFVPGWMFHLFGFFIRCGYAELRGPGVNGFLVARERYIDDVLQNYLNEGLQQLVILGAGYDSDLISLFIWQGVTMYLSPEGIDATLAFIAKNAATGSAVVLDYVYQAVLDGVQKQSEISSMQRYRFMTGEGLTFGIPEGRAEGFLRERGFRQVKDVTRDELKSMYFTGKNANRNVVGGYGIVIGKV